MCSNENSFSIKDLLVCRCWAFLPFAFQIIVKVRARRKEKLQLTDLFCNSLFILTRYFASQRGRQQQVRQDTEIQFRRQKPWHFVELVLVLGWDFIFITRTCYSQQDNQTSFFRKIKLRVKNACAAYLFAYIFPSCWWCDWRGMYLVI